MNGKICMVTGATSGIGLATALELAREGATVIIVSRDLQRCQVITSRIRQQTGSSTVEAFAADLSSQMQIRQLAEAFQSRYPRLDVLVNNAGAIFLKRQESADGIEMNFALNHLSYFLLTHLLLDTLKASAPARIVNVASDSHRLARINFNDIQGKQLYSASQAYRQSKLANMLFTYELARRLEGTQVTANALHPGNVATNIRKKMGLLAKLAMFTALISAVRPEEGARTSVYLASSPDVEGVSGKYFIREKLAPSDPASYDLPTARQLWEISAEMTGI